MDTKKSLPYQLLSPIAFVIDKLTKHRGFTHQILPFVFIAVYFYTKYYPLLMLGVGGLSHLLIDVITLKLHIRCSSRGEEVIYIVLWTVNILMMINLTAKNYNFDLVPQFLDLLNKIWR